MLDNIGCLIVGAWIGIIWLVLVLALFHKENRD